MIFAAGLGTRLRPLTSDRPKALVEVGKVPVLEHVARRLIEAGATTLIINTHHFPERIEEFIRARDDFGVDVRISYEPGAPLDTGGGLARARRFMRGDAPVLLHNCDVLSDIDLRALWEAHAADAGADATLAVLPDHSDRYLIFDDDGLCGYAPRAGGEDVLARDTRGTLRRRDFTGIHIISPDLLASLEDTDRPYSIIMHYLARAKRGHRARGIDQPGATWFDIGSHEKLHDAERVFGDGAATG